MTLFVLAACIGWALLRSNYERLARLKTELDTLQAARVRRLQFVHGEDKYLKERDPLAGDQVVVYRVALNNPSPLAIEKVKVVVQRCSTERSFVMRMPVRMRDQPNEQILNPGITVYPEHSEYPQVLEVQYDGGRMLGIIPSVVSGLPGHRINPGEHIVTLAAMGDGVDTITHTLRVVVINDPREPVTITPLD